MEPNSEKNHLDDLFARKLGKLERPPSSDSFARLQQRMQGGQEQTRVVFWRNQTVQMAAAACLAAVLLFGWLYSNDRSTNPIGNNPTASVSEKKQRTSETGADKQPTVVSTVNEETMPQLADNKPAAEPKAAGRKPSARANSERNQIPLEQKPLVATALATKAAQQSQRAAEMMIDKPTPTPVIAAVPQTAVASKPAAERVLIVTIQEPEALVAARQTATSVVNNMPVLAASPTKEGKASFWSQVKRLKQDDDVARQEGPTDESGLLSRAYKGIRQKLEKDKPAKQ
ncbi:hypothetical protein [Spirosoma rhododendri]|uniref:Uncharacterized protein n=1 Tax=Spirosoma rhododendri TaxID=2728024 RepID=A0A7L5DKU7_9BACT|nr:hypothetical protein [Spirosoma rhododendri]QJD78131.1 hypothetical protein HH216_06620 [Spirosoma rhododendri]